MSATTERQHCIMIIKSTDELRNIPKFVLSASNGIRNVRADHIVVFHWVHGAEFIAAVTVLKTSIKIDGGTKDALFINEICSYVNIDTTLIAMCIFGMRYVVLDPKLMESPRWSIPSRRNAGCTDGISRPILDLNRDYLPDGIPVIIYNELRIEEGALEAVVAAWKHGEEEDFASRAGADGTRGERSRMSAAGGPVPQLSFLRQFSRTSRDPPRQTHRTVASHADSADSGTSTSAAAAFAAAALYDGEIRPIRSGDGEIAATFAKDMGHVVQFGFMTHPLISLAGSSFLGSDHPTA
jgi:hypothetical protein